MNNQIKNPIPLIRNHPRFYLGLQFYLISIHLTVKTYTVSVKDRIISNPIVWNLASNLRIFK